MLGNWLNLKNCFFWGSMEPLYIFALRFIPTHQLEIPNLMF